MEKCNQRTIDTSELVIRIGQGEQTICHPSKCKILTNYGQEQDFCFFPDSGPRTCPIAIDHRKHLRELAAQLKHTSTLEVE